MHGDQFGEFECGYCMGLKGLRAPMFCLSFSGKHEIEMLKSVKSHSIHTAVHVINNNKFVTYNMCIWSSEHHM